MELASERILNAALFNLCLVEVGRGGGVGGVKMPTKVLWLKYKSLSICWECSDAARPEKQLAVPGLCQRSRSRLNSAIHCNPSALRWSDKKTLEESGEELPSARNYISVIFRDLEGEGRAVLPAAVRADGETPHQGHTACPGRAGKAQEREIKTMK